ncbi:MAG: hypothetical protein IJ716_09485 [Lachnospiraceae bacterium]|nr:hypothetical protein [Lachnospiraceae bacterium]
MEKKVKTIYDNLKNFRELIETACFFLAPINMFVYAAFQGAENTFDQKASEHWILKNISGNKWIFILSTVLFVALVLKLLYNTTKSYFVTTKWFSDFMNAFHAEYIHPVRDHIAQIEGMEDNIQKLNLENEMDVKIYNKMYSDEYTKLEKNVQQCVDQICKLLNELILHPVGKRILQIKLKLFGIQIFSIFQKDSQICLQRPGLEKSLKREYMKIVIPDSIMKAQL